MNFSYYHFNDPDLETEILNIATIKNDHKGNVYKEDKVHVSIVLTESTASLLGLKAQHLEDLTENLHKSRICINDGNLFVKNDFSRTKLLSNDAPDVDVAFSRRLPMSISSTSVAGMDDLSDENIRDRYLNEDVTNYLYPHLVFTKPLGIVRSNAHEDMLTLDKHNIYVDVLDNELPVTGSGWINVCRICHGGESQERLIGPCRCRGSVALAHMSCLERWLRESANSYCELCQHHYEIKRNPKYGIIKSVFVWLCNPGDHGPYLLEDFIAFCLYTPAAVCSTYILMMMCECVAKGNLQLKHGTSHLITFFAITGIAAIDFSYSTWFLMRFTRHLLAWKAWYKENCQLTLMIPPRKLRRLNHPESPGTVVNLE